MRLSIKDSVWAKLRMHVFDMMRAIAHLNTNHDRLVMLATGLQGIPNCKRLVQEEQRRR